MNCEIQNIVAHSEAKLKVIFHDLCQFSLNWLICRLPIQIDQRVDIQAMYNTHSINCTFQKSMFPGLIYRMQGCPIVMLCFSSGKMVLTGGKRIEDIEIGWSMLWTIVREFIQ